MKTEEQIELWYEEIKEKAFKSYIKAIDSHVDEVTREQKFLDEMQKIHLKYDKHHHAFMKRVHQKERMIHYRSIIASPFIFLWKCLFQGLKWTYASAIREWKSFRLWYRHGPGLRRATEKYIKATENEMKNRRAKQIRGAYWRPKLFTLKRPLKRFLQKSLITLEALWTNLKDNSKHYLELATKIGGAIWGGILKAKEFLAKYGTIVITVIKKIIKFPSTSFKWVKEQWALE